MPDATSNADVVRRGYEAFNGDDDDGADRPQALEPDSCKRRQEGNARREEPDVGGILPLRLSARPRFHG